MKNYLNLFHSLIDKIHYWNDLEVNKKTEIFDIFIDNSLNNHFLTEYFNNYYDILKNNTLNSYLKSYCFSFYLEYVLLSQILYSVILHSYF